MRAAWMWTGAIILLLLGGSALVVFDGMAGSERPNVVVVSVDTLRADHMPCYGYVRNTTPNICRLAGESVVFTEAYAQMQWSLISYSSLFTARYPYAVGMGFGEQGSGQRGPLPASRTTMAEVFRDNGYRTAAFVGGGGPGDIGPGKNLYQGFEELGWRNIRFNGTIPAFQEWLKRNPSDPFFAFVHGYDVHVPFRPPAPYDRLFAEGYTGPLRNETLGVRFGSKPGILDNIRRRNGGLVLERDNRTTPLGEDDLAYVRSQYDGEARFADAWIGRLIDTLRDRGVYDDTILVILADHGMNLADETWPNLLPRLAQYPPLFFRGGFRQHTLHVPLIMRIPGIAPRRVDRQVELVDVMPTLLELTGIRAGDRVETAMQGDRLTALIEGRETGINDYVYAGLNGRLGAVRSERWLLSVNRLYGNETARLYDRSLPPADRRDVSEQYPAVVTRLRERLEDWHATNVRALQDAETAR